MYFHLVYPPECFSDVSGRKSTHNVFSEATELMVTRDHEFVGNSTSPFFDLPFMPVSHGRLTRVIWAMEGCQKPKLVRAQTLTLCTCEHERK